MTSSEFTICLADHDVCNGSVKHACFQFCGKL